MRKFLIIFSILIIIAAVVFYFGWIQLKIDPDTIGVVHTKTGGYREKPIVEGSFYWAAGALIPDNLTIIQYPAKAVTLYVDTSIALQSAALYSETLIGTADFTYDFSYSISYRINPETAVSLLKDLGITPEGLGSWLDAQEASLKERASLELQQLFLQSGEPENSGGIRPPVTDTQLQELQQRIQRYFTFITISHLDIVAVDLPDFELYETAKAYYLDLAALKNQTLQEELRGTAQQRAENQVRLDMLQQYGYLLEEFPVLIEYFKADPELKSLNLEKKE